MPFEIADLPDHDKAETRIDVLPDGSDPNNALNLVIPRIFQCPFYRGGAHSIGSATGDMPVCRPVFEFCRTKPFFG